ncbi:protein MFI isoform X2 [Vicugna pacos]|uniref:Protein MFI isoform X2 n=1 Tax=Vicugna pacos TaxID=30538 RepID=A0ABM5CMW6_VICPA
MLLPSDVARLVLGYLQQENLTSTCQTFILESSNLKEYAEHCTDEGFIPACLLSLFGKNLTTILNEYVAMKAKETSNDVPAVMSSLWKKLDHTLSQIRSMQSSSGFAANQRARTRNGIAEIKWQRRLASQSAPVSSEVLTLPYLSGQFTTSPLTAAQVTRPTGQISAPLRSNFVVVNHSQSQDTVTTGEALNVIPGPQEKKTHASLMSPGRRKSESQRKSITLSGPHSTIRNFQDPNSFAVEKQMVIENAREKILSNKSLQEKLAENINKFLTSDSNIAQVPKQTDSNPTEPETSIDELLGLPNVAVFQHLKSLINIRRQGEPRQIVRYINPKEHFHMAWKQESEFTQRDKAAIVIQKAWKSFLNVAVFQHLKSLINIRRQGEPRQIVRYINPKEAELLDAAAGINVRFRLGGVKFPPEIYYKIFTHRHIEDLCANSPRDYTKLPAKYASHNKSDRLQEEGYSGCYRRVENNGWRPVSERFWTSTENVMVEDKRESEFHFSKLKRRQDMEKKRKIRKIEWMKQMYYAGNLEAKSTNHDTLGLIHTATKGLIKAIETGGIDSVMEWEVDEVLNWTNTLNFDEYIANWKEIATSNSSANFKSFRFKEAKGKIYDYEDKLEEEMGASEDTSFENIYEGPGFTRLTPDSTYGI